MEKQISIIIPTYNMEQYIEKCIESILIPEIDEIEVIIVNDGSTDKSHQIATEYAKKYQNSINIIDKPNGNYGSCINAALKHVKGRYVKVLDADDTFDTIALSEFVQKLRKIDDDVVITNHLIINSDGDTVARSHFDSNTPTDVTLSIQEASSTVANKYLQMHRIAYHHRIFNRLNYYQSEGVSYSDSQWAIIPLAYCTSFRCLNICLYRYLIGREGQTMDSKQMSKFMSNFFTVLMGLLTHYNSYPRNDIGKAQLLRHIVEVHEFVYFKAIGNPTEKTMALLKDYETSLKKTAHDVFNAVGQIPWTSEVAFPFVNDLRKKNYPANYNIPLWQRIILSAKIRLQHWF